MEKLVHKEVALNLTRIDGNAFSLMGAFKASAKEEGWSDEEIKTVLDRCMKGDYRNLVAILSAHCQNGGM